MNQFSASNTSLFETAQKAHFFKYDFNLDYNDIGGTFKTDRNTAKGDWLLLDPTYSIGPVMVALGAQSPNDFNEHVIMTPGDMIVGSFDGFNIASAGGAFGRFLFGKGAAPTVLAKPNAVIGAVTDPRIAGNIFQVTGTTATPASFTIALPTGFTGTTRPYRGIGIRRAQLVITATIPTATALVFGPVVVRLTNAANASPFYVARTLPINIASNASNNIAIITAELPEIAVSDLNGASAASLTVNMIGFPATSVSFSLAANLLYTA